MPSSLAIPGQRPTAAHQQGYRFPLELIRKMTPSLAHSTPFRSRRSLAKVSTISREPHCVGLPSAQNPGCSRVPPRRTASRSDLQPDRHCPTNDVDPQVWLGDLLARQPSSPQDRRTAAVELATAFDTAKSGSLILAAITCVFTIRYVANLLGE